MRDFTAKTRALVALAMLAGCTHGSDQSDTANSDDTKGATDAEDFAIDTAEDALLRESVGGHLEACEGVRDACGREDKGRTRLRQSGPSDVCKTEVRECLSAVVERAKTVIRALHACRDSALECVADDSERMACRNEFRACVASVFHGDGGARDAGRRDAGIGAGLDGGAGRSRRDAGTRGTETPRGSGGVISPVSQLDGGTRRDAGAAGRGTSSGGLSSEACIAQLEACAESNQDPDVCAAMATACVGRE